MNRLLVKMRHRMEGVVNSVWEEGRAREREKKEKT